MHRRSLSPVLSVAFALALLLVGCGTPPPEVLQADPQAVGESVSGTVVGGTGVLFAGQLLYQTAADDQFGLADATALATSRNLPAYYSGTPGVVTLLYDGAVVGLRFQAERISPAPQVGDLVYLAATPSGQLSFRPPVESGNHKVSVGTVKSLAGYDPNHQMSLLSVEVRVQDLGLVP